jgi:hypothetical protein
MLQCARLRKSSILVGRVTTPHLHIHHGQPLLIDSAVCTRYHDWLMRAYLSLPLSLACRERQLACWAAGLERMLFLSIAACLLYDDRICQ